jgi:uncharacterized coiled-coil protein SlyX
MQMSAQQNFYDNLLLVLNSLKDEIKANRAEINKLIEKVDKLENQEK